MTVKLISFWIVFMLFSFFREALSTKKGYYTIVAPGTLQPNSVFHVSLTLNDFHKSCWFNITLSTYPEHNKIYTREAIEVKPGTTKLVELHVPSFNTTGFLANFEAFGYRGIISKDSQIVYLESEKYWPFIQTNKAKYKPGESVQFRVICIDQLTRPAKLDDKLTVKIYDEYRNLLRTIPDVKFIQGVFRSEFQISEYPILGTWTINVENNDGRQLALKKFEVERYVLPKFSVIILPKKVSIYDKQMPLQIFARYFYGKRVQGNLFLTVLNFHTPTAQLLPPLTGKFKINGTAIIILDLKKDLKIKLENNTSEQNSSPYSAPPAQPEELYKFDIEAIVTDKLSEEQSRMAIEVAVYSQPFKIELQVPNVFEPNPLLNIKIKILITDLNDNLHAETKAPIQIIVGCHTEKDEYSYDDFDIVRIDYKKEIGKDFAIIQVTNTNYSECYLYAEYQRSKSLKKWMKKKVASLDMEILTKSPQEGKILEIKITNPVPIEEFSYEIVSKRDIIQSDHVNVPGNKTTYILRINVTFSMVPKITIYSHLISNMSFNGQLKDVLIKRAFQNSIKITTNNETKPGSSININVTTDEGSYVGLMGLDRSVLNNLKKEDIFNDHYVNAELSNVNSLNFYPTPYYGRTGDIITFSNAFPKFGPSGGGGGRGHAGLLPPKRIRKLFPESWLFIDFEKSPAGGFNVLETVPDSITTWAITGFSINPDTGLAFTKNTTNLRVFQEFFISMDLPNLVKEGETIEIPIYISNSLDQDALTNVTVESDSKNLDILEQPEDISKPKQLIISEIIFAKQLSKFVFFLKPLKSGIYNVTVKAISPGVASDAIQKTFNVQPEGMPYAMSKTYLVHLPEENIQEDEITIDIPENAVNGSQRVDVSVVGDIFQPLMRDIQKLAKIPYGNCEENMRQIVSNSLVLLYLKVLNYSNPGLETKIKRNIELGYQNHLSFKYLDGSFGLLERKSERTGDIWQTLFSLWGLELANEFVGVDPYIIKRGLEYLKSKQQENGCFKSESGLEEDVRFTAFGLMVFLMDERPNSANDEVIKKGLEYLYDITDDLEYSPISVMSTYALLLGKHEKAGDHLEKLTSNSPLTSKQILWTKSDTLDSHLHSVAGSLINLFESQEIPQQGILQVVRGLIISKDDEEFSLTHMIALKAMIAFVEKLRLTKTNLEITFKDDQNKSGEFRINADNSQVLQTFEISKSSRKLNIHSKGHGFAVVDVKYKYNLVPENQSSSFSAISISNKRISKHLGVLQICTSAYKSNNDQTKLTTMEVSLQSGFIFIEKVENLSGDTKSIQINDSRDKAVVYFEPKVNETCIELEVRKSYNVYNSKPGWVILYGSHNKDQRATKSFRFNDFE